MRIEGSSNCSRFGNQYDTIDIFVSQLVDHYNSLPQILYYVLANTQLVNDIYIEYDTFQVICKNMLSNLPNPDSFQSF